MTQAPESAATNGKGQWGVLPHPPAGTIGDPPYETVCPNAEYGELITYLFRKIPLAIPTQSRRKLIPFAHAVGRTTYASKHRKTMKRAS
jgi:hypothetical protein